jgi:hypothetical protein
MKNEILHYFYIGIKKTDGKTTGHIRTWQVIHKKYKKIPAHKQTNQN